MSKVKFEGLSGSHTTSGDSDRTTLGNSEKVPLVVWV